MERLRAMGAQMYQEASSVVIAPSAISIGNQSFTGMDVRTAAVVLVGALQAPGQTTIYDAQHLFRGYSPEFIPNINAIGGDITMLSTFE